MRQGFHQGFFWIGLGIGIIFFSLRLPLGDVRGAFNLPGPGFFPLILGIIVALLGLVMLARPRSGSGKPEPKGAFRANRRVLNVAGSLIVYVIIFERLGFLIATFFFLLLLFRGISSQRWATSVAASAGAAIACYLVFDIWLKAQLPKGILFS